MVKIVCALNSFKGCMTSHEANEAASEGIKWCDRDAIVESFDVSDGGDGFLEAMCPDEIVKCHVHDALMRWRDSKYGIKDGKAIIEVAKVCGLAMVEPEFRNPLIATSYGIGEQMVQAWNRGCREFIIGLGGSATSDCGLGMLKCLRHAWQVANNKMWYEPFDTSSLEKIKVTIATDVDNPLFGQNGAAYVFGPQKGADVDMVKKLDRRAETFARMAAKHTGRDMSQTAGAGAAGGLGYAFLEFMDTTIAPGAELVLKSVGFDKSLDDASLVITGEGGADEQTLMGKLPAVILRHACAKNVSVALMAGKVENKEKLLDAGFKFVRNINDGHLTDSNSMRKDVAMLRLSQCCSHLR